MCPSPSSMWPSSSAVEVGHLAVFVTSEFVALCAFFHGWLFHDHGRHGDCRLAGTSGGDFGVGGLAVKREAHVIGSRLGRHRCTSYRPQRQWSSRAQRPWRRPRRSCHRRSHLCRRSGGAVPAAHCQDSRSPLGDSQAQHQRSNPRHQSVLFHLSILSFPVPDLLGDLLGVAAPLDQ